MKRRHLRPGIKKVIDAMEMGFVASVMCMMLLYMYMYFLGF